MTEDFFIRDRRAADHTVVTIGGELDVATEPALRSHLSELMGNGRTRLVLDLAPLEFLDAYSLRVLVWALGRVLEQGGWLRLVNVPFRIRRLLGVARLAHALPVYASITEALGAAPPGHPPAALSAAATSDTATAPRPGTAPLPSVSLPRLTGASAFPPTSTESVATVLPR
jgi:anti-anti-sigma factor